jgi:hypothetical protein
MSITADNFEPDVKQNVRDFLRDEINDPLGSDRNKDDYFIFNGEPNSELEGKKHRVPTVILDVAKATTSYIGSAGVEDDPATMHTVHLRFRIITKYQRNFKDLVGQLNSLLKKNPDAAGTNSHGHSYSLEELHDGEKVDSQNRGGYRSDGLREKVIEWRWDAAFV